MQFPDPDSSFIGWSAQSFHIACFTASACSLCLHIPLILHIFLCIILLFLSCTWSTITALHISSFSACFISSEGDGTASTIRRKVCEVVFSTTVFSLEHPQ